MYSHTRRIGSVGRFGVRTGKKVREEIKKIEEAEENSVCPSCNRKIRKTAPGVWVCRFCKNKFAGASYLPASEKKIVELEE